MSKHPNRFALRINDTYLNRLGSWYGNSTRNKVVDRFLTLYYQKNPDDSFKSITEYVNNGTELRSKLDRYVSLYYPLVRNKK